MERSGGGSLFHRKIDRVAFTTYLLGAIVPLIALGVVVDRFALPEMTDRNASYGLIGVVVSITILSLLSFVVLRHVTRRTIRVMDRDNRRLSSLLQVSRSLAAAGHVTEATRTAAHSALDLTDSADAYLYVREGEKLSLAESAGEDPDALYQKIKGPLDEIASLVMQHGRPVHRNPSASDENPFAAIAVPLPGERGAVGALAIVRPGGGAAFRGSEPDALSTLAALAAVSLHNADLRDAQRNFFSHVTDMLATALDAHLGFNTGHGQRVAQLANQVGRALELTDDRLHRLHFASLLHDIGMLRLDRNQQMNPRTCEKHCTLGFRMLNRIRLWKEMAPIVHAHHEWWDGSGYPEGLSGEAIPLEARIIALCDAYDSITSEASYRSALSPAEAIAEIERCKATQFDPAVVEAFARLFEDGALPG